MSPSQTNRSTKYKTLKQFLLCVLLIISLAETKLSKISEYPNSD